MPPTVSPFHRYVLVFPIVNFTLEEMYSVRFPSFDSGFSKIMNVSISNEDWVFSIAPIHDSASINSEKAGIVDIYLPGS